MNYFDRKRVGKIVSIDGGPGPFNWPDRSLIIYSLLQMKLFSCHTNSGMLLNDPPHKRGRPSFAMQTI